MDFERLIAGETSIPDLRVYGNMSIWKYIHTPSWMEVDGLYITVELASSLVNIFGLLFEETPALLSLSLFPILSRFLYDPIIFWIH